MQHTHHHHSHHKPAPSKALSPYEKWQATVDASPKQTGFSDWDHAIQASLIEYEKWLKVYDGFQSVSAVTIKAMTLVETGGPASPYWSSRPLQIGNKGDFGMKELLKTPKDPGEKLILWPELRAQLEKGNISAELNLKAGIGYLYELAAHYGPKTVPDADSTEYTYTVEVGDKGIETIATKLGTTETVLRSMNAIPSVLHAGRDTFKYKKATQIRWIDRWTPITPRFIATRYNYGKDGGHDYLRKLQHVLTKVLI